MVNEKNNIELEKNDKEEVAESEFEKLYKETIKVFNEGEIIKGKIVAINPKDVVVDIGYKP